MTFFHSRFVETNKIRVSKQTSNSINKKEVFLERQNNISEFQSPEKYFERPFVFFSLSFFLNDASLA
jgi:hypothetical protein